MILQKEKKIVDYRQRLGKHVQETTAIPLRERISVSTSHETFPSALTTTALIENLPTENTGNTFDAGGKCYPRSRDPSLTEHFSSRHFSRNY